jgi:hypothetical protein
MLTTSIELFCVVQPGAKQKKRSPAEIEAERQAQLAAELAEQQGVDCSKCSYGQYCD